MSLKMNLETSIFRHDKPEAPARQISTDMRGGISRGLDARNFRFEKDFVVPPVHRAAQRVGSVLDSLMAQGVDESSLSAFVRQHYSALGLSVDALQDPLVLASFVEVVLELKSSDLRCKNRLYRPDSESGKAIDSQLSWLTTYAPEAKVFLTRGLYRRWLLNAAAIVRELETRNDHAAFSEVIRALRIRAATIMAQAQAYDHINEVDFMEDFATLAEDSLISSLAICLENPEGTLDKPNPVAAVLVGDGTRPVCHEAQA